MNLAALINQFKQSYGSTPRVFSAPGRVNLIGEHTDYNEGFVLPMAIDRRTFVAAATNGSRRVRVQSLDLNDQAEFSLDDPDAVVKSDWVRYVAGVGFALDPIVGTLSAADLTISSDVPIGAGLASSAALEISVGSALLTLSEKGLDRSSLALTAQKAEHVYVGTRCGVMDQLTAAAARKGHALLIDCRSLAIKHITINLPDTMVVICNTNVKHNLATSAYNQRRQECEQAVEILRPEFPSITALRDLTFDDLRNHQQAMPETIYRRARHVITENARTLAAAQALERGNAEEFGRLMWASHESLRDDYQVTCAELDLMVELAANCEGVRGARMTGGGFGGCTVNLVRSDQIEFFGEVISNEYYRRTQIHPDIYVVSADDGMKEIDW